jgi:hypothetical protein
MTGNSPDDGGAPPPIYNGRYELVSQIARGGTAQVYLARDLLLDRPVALKVLFPELSSDSSFVERFRREAQAAANLSHPNIVPVFDWGESERTYFIVMERVDGEPLSAVIRAQAPLPAMRAAAIAGDIAKALSYAHRRGVVHRDVKPGNVLITRDGQVKVADFGIARAVGHDDSVTQTGLVMGTATYFSPEQAQGLGVDGRSDVYSLGVVLYEMVTGRAPFVADTPVAIAYKHVSETPVPPRQIDPRVPAALEGVILRAMAKNPADRYATAEDLHADLERFAQGVAVLAPEVSGGMLTQAMSAAPGSATTVLQSQAGAADATVAIGAGGGGGGAATTGQQAVNGGGPGGLPSKPAMPKRQWIPWTIVGILLIAAIYPLVEYGAHKLGYLGGPGYFHMPALDNHTLASAEGTLKKDGLVADLHAVDKVSRSRHDPDAGRPGAKGPDGEGDVFRWTGARAGTDGHQSAGGQRGNNHRPARSRLQGGPRYSEARRERRVRHRSETVAWNLRPAGDHRRSHGADGSTDGTRADRFDGQAGRLCRDQDPQRKSPIRCERPAVCDGADERCDRDQSDGGKPGSGEHDGDDPLLAGCGQDRAERCRDDVRPGSGRHHHCRSQSGGTDDTKQRRPEGHRHHAEPSRPHAGAGRHDRHDHRRWGTHEYRHRERTRQPEVDSERRHRPSADLGN